MAGATGAFIVAAAFLTALLSGVFGMAGGLVLMGALAFVLPVSAAFVTHGILQLVANGWRAILHRAHIRWGVIAFYGAGSVTAALLVHAVAFVPSRPLLFLMLGLVPMLIWLPRTWLSLDAGRPPQAVACGFAVTGLNLVAGVAGPALDLFFVRTELSRHEIVSTKAASQVLAHGAKIAVYGAPLLAAGGQGMPQWWVFALSIPFSVVGTTLGGRILDRLSDRGFKRATALLVTAIGCLYLLKAIQSWQ
ncbi:MAG: TSUP family transporter [Sphingobium sp.]